jgi:hypothetical protein
MGRFQHRVVDRIAYCRSFTNADERTNKLSGGAALGWNLFIGGDVLVGGAVAFYSEKAEPGVENMKEL